MEKMMRPRLACFAAFCVLIGCVDASSQARIATAIDAIVEAPIKAGKVAGASVAVVKGSETLVMKGYGFADLELDVPTPPGATYEIGSVTKQFTAASILLLAEQGKLSLDDDLTKFLPDYPTQGNRVTIRRLLNHTSGLGLIIEKASGKTYEDFVNEHLFDRVEIKDSYYCSERTIRKNHAHGYDTDRNGPVLKACLDHTWPYAAGSLFERDRSRRLEQPQTLKYYGNDTFGFKDTLVTFEKENGKVSRLRLDSGGGYNILSRQSDSQK
jgi:CubicO group peptidase (beta-lactamase class C family)